ncbi:hypothetical protein [Lactobacillus sp. UCMA15818]|uniref:hypothetical protein n=1 Tax=Lactobacillus sp. UCMA15818 TaxID=2583394 RepID=UPI0025B1A9E0|nr:hypothetical protein [Lactobacillus sp. UCMA15818]
MKWLKINNPFKKRTGKNIADENKNLIVDGTKPTHKDLIEEYETAEYFFEPRSNQKS